jgi:exonuclease III
MIKFLFWNTRRKVLENLVAELCQIHQIDILILVENTALPSQMLSSLNVNSSSYRFHHSPSEKTKLYSRLSNTSIKNIRDNIDVSFRLIRLPSKKDILLVAAHLPSKLHMNLADQSQLCVRISQLIREVELKIGHQRTIVVGDFNMNPFEDGLISSEGFHAVMTRTIASKGTRKVRQVEKPFFYNPMWNRFGDSHIHGRFGPKPAGTYYYQDAKPVTFFWHMFDQVLIRPELLDCFDDQDLHIITTAGNNSLIRADQTPNAKVASDHLPIIFTLKLIDR